MSNVAMIICHSVFLKLLLVVGMKRSSEN